MEITPEGVLAAALPFRGQARQIGYGGGGCLRLRCAAGRRASFPALKSRTCATRSGGVGDSLCARAGFAAPRAVTLVLPDTLVRVFVLDFDSLPAKAAEAISVVRFRLRKMVPFDVEHAGVSYQVLAQSEDECKVLAAVIPGPVLAEYEAAVRAAGYEPGAVLPSSLAALEAVDEMEAVLAANLSATAMTTSIANGQDLLLYRTLELPADPAVRIARDSAQHGRGRGLF